jgi:fibronectin-binding autotransporter adhesin
LINFGTNTATFGLATGTINVSGTVDSGNITLGTQSGVITLSGGTINLASNVTIHGGGGTIEIGSLITGASTAINKTGSTTTLRFTNTNNSYTGLTSIIGTLAVTSLTDGGSNSSIGASSNAASNLIIGSSGGATLSYIGSSNASTDRLFSIASTNSNIASNGDGTLNFTNTGAIAYGTANQVRTLGLSGTNTGLNILSASIGDNGTGAVSFTKSGTGNWVLANNSNSYTGQTSISQGGTLSVSKMADYGTNSAIGHGTVGVGISFNGSLVYTGTGDDTNRLIRFDGNGTILNNGSGALNFTETGNFNVQANNNTARTFTLGGTNGGTISGAIQNNNTGVVSLTKTGSGAWTLGGASTYTGTTAIQQGNLIAGANAPSAANGAFGNASSDINLGVAGGNDDAGLLIGGAFNVGRNIRILTSNNSDSGTRVLTIGGNTAATSEFSGNIFLGSTSQAGRGVTLTAANGGQVTFSGVIQNPTGMDATTYTVTKAGLGTVALTNTNTYTGATTVKHRHAPHQWQHLLHQPRHREQRRHLGRHRHHRRLGDPERRSVPVSGCQHRKSRHRLQCLEWRLDLRLRIQHRRQHGRGWQRMGLARH